MSKECKLEEEKVKKECCNKETEKNCCKPEPKKEESKDSCCK